MLEDLEEVKIKPTIKHYDLEVVLFIDSYKKADFSNKLESIQDLLVDAKYVEDDNYLQLRKLILHPVIYRKGMAGALVTIHEIAPFKPEIYTTT